MGFDVSKIVKAVETFVNGKDSEISNNAIDTGAEKKFASIFYGKVINSAVNRGDITKDEANKIFGLELSGSALKPRRAEGTGGDGDNGGDNGGEGTGGVGGDGNIDWSNGVTVNVNIENNWYINVNITTQTDDIVNKLIETFLSGMTNMTNEITGSINNMKNELLAYLQGGEDNIKAFLVDLFNKVDANSKLELDALQKILAQIENMGIHIEGMDKAINDLLNIQIEAVKSMDIKLDKLVSLVQENNELVQENNENTKAQNKLLTLIYDAITKLTANFENFTDVQQKQLNAVLEMLDSNKASYAQIIALLQAIQSDTSENCDNSKKIIELIAEGKTEILEALANINADFNEFGDDIKSKVFDMYNALIQLGDQFNTKDINKALQDIKKLLADIKVNGDQNNTDISTLIELVKEGNTTSTKILEAINNLNTKFDGFSADMKAQLTKIYAKIGTGSGGGGEGGSTDISGVIDLMQQMLEKLNNIDKNTNETNENVKNIVNQFDEVITLCEENNVEQKDTNSLLKNLTELVDNLDIDVTVEGGGTGGGTVDFTKVIQAITTTGDKITSTIKNLTDMTNTMNANLLEFKEQNHKDLAKLQQLTQIIIDMLGNLPDGTDINNILTALNNIYNKIDHIEIDVNGCCTCHCKDDGNKPHEGELSDLNNALGAKAQFVFDSEVDAISNPTVGKNGAKKFTQNGQVFIRHEDGRVFDMSGRERPDIK